MKFNIFPKMLSLGIPFLEVIKMAIAFMASIALLGFAGVTLAVSTTGLFVSIPLFIIFIPVLVPATIATTLLATGITAGGSFGVTALGLIIWLIKPFFGTFQAKPASGATPAGGATPPSEAASGGGSNPFKIFTWSWSWGNPFIGGGSSPTGGLKWNWSWGGKSYSGTIPFGGKPVSGGTPAGGSPTTE